MHPPEGVAVAHVSAPVELREIELMHRGDASFDFEVGRHAFAVGFRELLLGACPSNRL